MSTAPRRGWTLALTSVALFMVALDTLVVATALPVLRVDLGATLEELEWTVNAYNLGFAVLLLTGAALGDRFGRRRMFALGIGVFTAASAAAALSPDAGALIAARAVQGIGASLVMPLTLTLLSEAFPAERRGMALGVWSGIAGLAVASGPLVGGAVIEGISWQWIFWLNVPIGLVAIPLALGRLRESFGPRAPLDLRGLALASAGLFAVVWALVRGESAGWASGEILGLFAAGAFLTVAFVHWELRAPAPMLPMRFFSNRTFAAANAASFLMYGSLFGAVFLMTQYLQTLLGHSPLEAGLRLLPWTGAPLLVSPLAGVLSDRLGQRPFMAAGLALQGVGFGWIALAASSTRDYGGLLAPLLVAGVGISMVFPTVANAVLGAVRPHEVGPASGTNSALRELGGVFGVAVFAALFARRGGFSSAETFTDGFSAALWLGAGLSAAGALVALAVGRPQARAEGLATTRPARASCPSRAPA